MVRGSIEAAVGGEPAGAKDVFLRVSAAQRRYFGGAMSLRWWYRQVEEGKLPHLRAGTAVLLRPSDIQAFVATMFCEKKTSEAAAVPVTTPSTLKPRSDRRGVRFFGD